MLPTVNLDDERFEEIMDKARKMIPNFCPHWTDYNYHDPGITVLELLAWLKETQQFHMDQIGPDHIRQYMMLLGERQEHITPATALITVSPPDKPEVVPRGSRFWASSIPFETTDFRYLEKSQIVKLLTVDMEYSTQNRHLHIPMFGSSPASGMSFQVGFSAPLEKKKEHQLYFQFFHEYPVDRNPIGKRKHFVPLATLTVEYFYEGGFHPVEWWVDETHQFLEDGVFVLRFKKNMEPDQEGCYWLRFTLQEEEYDVPPILEKISLHKLQTVQMRTLSECHRFRWGSGREVSVETDTFLGASGSYEIYYETEQGFRRYEGPLKREECQGQTRFTLMEHPEEEMEEGILLCFEKEMEDKRLLGVGDGFPNQELEVEIPGLCSDGLEILVETKRDSNLFELWRQVENFSGCGPLNRSYTYDEENGILAFGNGIRGKIPQGRILMAAGHTSLGAKGNVKAGVIQMYETDTCFESIVNLEAARGGKNRETLAECQARINRKLEQVERAVTYEDYEALTKRTPGLMIEKVRAIPASHRIRQNGSVDENRVTLVVKPYSDKPRPVPGQAYIKNIINMLEPRRLIGTRLNILPPEYIGITLFAEIETDADYKHMRQKVEEALRGYFERQENNFGQMVSYGAIYGIIDGMDHVTMVRTLSLDARGNTIQRSPNGDILLPANGLAYLQEWDFMISLIR